MSQVRSGNHKVGFHGRENARWPPGPLGGQQRNASKGARVKSGCPRVPGTSLTASLRKKLKLVKEMRNSNQSEASLGDPWGDLTIGEQA